MNDWYRIRHRIAIQAKDGAIFMLMLAVLMVFSSEAYAQTLPSILVDMSRGECDRGPAMEHIFTSFVCHYQVTTVEVLSSVYFGMIKAFREPFYAALTLFVACTGAMYAFQIIDFSFKSIMVVLAKISIISGFAMYPELTIDILYTGLVGFINESTEIVIGILGTKRGLSDVPSIFSWMDERVGEFLQLQGDAQAAEGAARCDNNILALLFTLAVTVPPFFTIGLYVMVQFAMVFVRTVLGYLMAMTGIMFLITLAPLYFGFALFNTTKTLFDKWVGMLLGFAMQIFIVFAFIATMLSLPFDDKIKGILDSVKPYDKIVYHDGQRLDYNNWCTLCAPASDTASIKESIGCTGTAITPTNMAVGGSQEMVKYMTKELLSLAILAYIASQVLSLAPRLATSIGGGGVGIMMSARLPMEGRLTQMGNSFLANSRSGRFLEGARDGFAGFLRGGGSGGS